MASSVDARRSSPANSPTAGPRALVSKLDARARFVKVAAPASRDGTAG